MCSCCQGDHVVSHNQRPLLAAYDKYLKAFRYTQALDAAINVSSLWACVRACGRACGRACVNQYSFCIKSLPRRKVIYPCWLFIRSLLGQIRAQKWIYNCKICALKILF